MSDSTHPGLLESFNSQMWEVEWRFHGWGGSGGVSLCNGYRVSDAEDERMVGMVAQCTTGMYLVLLYWRLTDRHSVNFRLCILDHTHTHTPLLSQQFFFFFGRTGVWS
jgi:hypothetical protein